MSVYKRGKGRTGITTSECERALPRRNSRGQTKQKAEQAESKIKQEIFEGRFGLIDLRQREVS